LLVMRRAWNRSALINPALEKDIALLHP
jgi:hypothetical protein